MLIFLKVSRIKQVMKEITISLLCSVNSQWNKSLNLPHFQILVTKACHHIPLRSFKTFHFRVQNCLPKTWNSSKSHESEANPGWKLFGSRWYSRYGSLRLILFPWKRRSQNREVSVVFRMYSCDNRLQLARKHSPAVSNKTSNGFRCGPRKQVIFRSNFCSFEREGPLFFRSFILVYDSMQYNCIICWQKSCHFKFCQTIR